MNRRDLVQRTVERTELTSSQATAALNALLEGIGAGLERGEVVQVAGLGTFSVHRQAARQVRHPRTGQLCEVAAGRKVRYVPAKKVKGKLGRC